MVRSAPFARDEHAQLYKVVAQRLTRAVRLQSKPGVIRMSCGWNEVVQGRSLITAWKR